MGFLKKISTFIDKHFGIGVAVIIGIPVIAISVCLALFLTAPKDEASKNSSGDESFVISASSDIISSKEQTVNATVSDITDDTLDPEILEQKAEVGAKVNAEDLTVKKGESHGIDVSKWQGKIDWARVKKSGIDFAFIRIGYRAENGKIYKDDTADYNIQQAQKNDVLVGVYFFSTAKNSSEAIEEAKWTINAIKGYSISYPVVYDCEGFLNPSSRMYKLSAGDRSKNAVEFLKTVKNAGYDAMFYGAAAELDDPDCWDMSVIEATYKVWVAHYPEKTYPKVKAPYYFGKYDAWQYTNKGVVNGISGSVDMVVAYFTKEKAEPKNKNAKLPTVSAPLTEEEKIYTKVNEEVTAKDETNLRSAPNTNSDIIYTLKNGEFVKRVGIGSNGWSKLEYKGKTVYAVSSFLTTSKTPSSKPETSQSDGFKSVNEQVTAKDATNLRNAPSTEGTTVVYTLKNGEFIKRVGVHPNGWSKLIYNGKTVYAISNFLTTSKTPSSKPETSQSDGFKSVNEQFTAKDATNLRNAPSTEGTTVVYTLKNGEFIKRIGVHSNGWSKLEYKGQIVYAVSSFLTTEKTTSKVQSATESSGDGFDAVDEEVTAKNETNLRNAPSTEGTTVFYTLKNGEYIKRVGVNSNGWSKLEYNGQTVYAVSQYLVKKGE